MSYNPFAISPQDISALDKSIGKNISNPVSNNAPNPTSISVSSPVKVSLDANMSTDRNTQKYPVNYSMTHLNRQPSELSINDNCDSSETINYVLSVILLIFIFIAIGVTIGHFYIWNQHNDDDNGKKINKVKIMQPIANDQKQLDSRSISD